MCRVTNLSRPLMPLATASAAARRNRSHAQSRPAPHASRIPWVYVEQQFAVWPGDAFGFVGSEKQKRPAAIWAAHGGGRNAPGFSLDRLGARETDLIERNHSADKDPRRLGAVIYRRKSI